MQSLRGGFYTLAAAWMLFVTILIYMGFSSIKDMGSNAKASLLIEKWNTPEFQSHRWPTGYADSLTKTPESGKASSGIPWKFLKNETSIKNEDKDSYTKFQSQIKYDTDLRRLIIQVNEMSKKYNVEIDDELLFEAIEKLKTKHNYPKNADGTWIAPVTAMSGTLKIAQLTNFTQNALSTHTHRAGVSSAARNAALPEEPTSTAADTATAAIGKLSKIGTKSVISLDSPPAVVQHLRSREVVRERLRRPADKEFPAPAVPLSESGNIQASDGAVGASSSSPRQTSLDASVKRSDVGSRSITVLSTGRPAASDVRGNLGPASVITAAKSATENWLTDRWQAASDMGGTPIPGAHWIEVDLQRLCFLDSILIDWEEAYSAHWQIKGQRTDGKCSNAEDWTLLARSKDAVQKPGGKPKHVVQTVRIRDNHYGTGQPEDCSAPYFDKVRLYIAKPSTRFGSSIWRLEVMGSEALEAIK